MVCFLIALAILLAGGLLAFAAGAFRSEIANVAACLLGAGSAVLGGALVMATALRVLLSGREQTLRLAWPLPLASANMELDPLSAFFAVTVALVTMLAAIYGGQYLLAHAIKGDSPHLCAAPSGPFRQMGTVPFCGRKKLGTSWLFFNLLTVSMLVVVAARNGVLFLASWELMSLSSFFLVTQEHEKEDVRRAGWTYLVAMHLGTVFLLALFLLLGRNAESLDFDRFSTAAAPTGLLFLLAVVGFGAKAGFIPLHVWLPEAHPAAPSHVSAVMSGVMIKMGIYGLLRMLTLLGEPAPWWGWTLLLIGLVSGVLGVLYALAQHDLKRLLAYHSVENIGIIALGLGLGLLGISYKNPAMAMLGFTGALLHVLNHALFKSLLFLCAGSVLHATNCGQLDRLGGLLRRMPVTGVTFLIAAVAIVGLPPLNGFVSEFLIYLAALAGLKSPAGAAVWPLTTVVVIGGLALIGGLAAACFAKAFGIVFLGEARSAEVAQAHEAEAAMQWPMVMLAALCVAIGLTAPLWPSVLAPAVAAIVPGAQVASAQPLTGIVLGSCLLLALIVMLVLVRRKVLAGRRVERAVTWDCGYTAPTPRMQYTASSFAQPLVLLFRLFLQPREEIHRPEGLFPKRASLHTHTADVFRQRIYQPLFTGIAWLATKLHWFQQGRIQVYVLYIALTIFILLIWKLG